MWSRRSECNREEKERSEKVRASYWGKVVLIVGELCPCVVSAV